MTGLLSHWMVAGFGLLPSELTGPPLRNMATTAIAFVELINLSCGIERLLLTSVKRVALRADFYAQIFTVGRACGKCVATTAADSDFLIFRVDFRFHDNSLLASA